MRRSVIEVWRGSVVESAHRVSVAVSDASGRLRAGAGDPALVVFARSAVKPLQAVPLVEDGAADEFALTQQELALCCASHGGEERHVQAAMSVLRRIGLEEEALACGPHMPMHGASAEMLRAQGRSATRVHNNCSGKHAGMLALARSHGWPVLGYERADHAVQMRMLDEMARWSRVAREEIPTAVDGCGVITFALPLAALARAFGAFAGAARAGEAAPSRIVESMVRWPDYVAGTGRLCTQLMRVSSGRIFAKTGAEGVYCAGVPGAELGVALKVEDGGGRASGPALLAVLKTLGLLSELEMADLAEFAEPEITNTRGDRVGAVRAVIELEAVGD